MITEHLGLDPKSPAELHKSYKSVPLEDKAFERLVRSIATQIRRAKGGCKLGAKTWTKVANAIASKGAALIRRQGDIGIQDAGWGGLLFAIVDMEACGTGAQNRWSGESWCATDAYSPSLRVLFTPPAKAATPQKAALADITNSPEFVPTRKPIKQRDPDAPVGHVIRWDAPEAYAITFDDGRVELNPKPDKPTRKKASKKTAAASREGKRARPPVHVHRRPGGDPGGDSGATIPSPTTSPVKRKPRLQPIKKKPKPKPTPTGDRQNKRGRADIKGQSKLSRFFVAKARDGPRTKLDMANSQLDNVHAIVARIDDPLDDVLGDA